MIYLVAGLCLALVGSCGLTLALVFKFVVGPVAAERASWAVERADLLQRIQAPAEAVVQHAMLQPFPSPPAIPVDDDQAFWEANMTKDQLAALAAEQELAEV